MTTTILLIRHGETAWNAERRLQGHIDIGLNAEGERQAQALAVALADMPPDAIVASDLQRAHHTAQAIGRACGRAVQTDAGLRERCYGAFEGLLRSEIEQRYPVEFAAMKARQIAAVIPDGRHPAESFRQFYERCVDAITRLGQRYHGQTLALVAHGGVLECAYRAALGMPLDTPRNFTVLNASINRFTLADGKLTLRSWGEVEHLNSDLLDELS